MCSSIFGAPARPRRRRGSTSPPLMCIESNPGPKEKAKRKTKKIVKQKSPKPLEPAELKLIKREVAKGTSSTTIAKLLDRDLSTICKRAAEFRLTGNVAKKARTGRPSSLTKRDSSLIVRKVRRNRKLTATDMSVEYCGDKSKRKTMSRLLNKHGLRARLPRKKPFISKKNIGDRICWATMYQGMSAEDWKNVIWSDEAPFSLVPKPPKGYVRRDTDEELKLECMQPSFKHGGGGINVWGCFSYNTKGPLYWIEGTFTGKRYLEEILNPLAIPFIFDVGRDMMLDAKDKKAKVYFQDDNSAIHREKNHPRPRMLELPELAELEGFEFEHMTWPAQSPDLNPIENIWALIKKKLWERKDRPKNKKELFAMVQEEWDKLPMEEFQKFVRNMPNRLHEVHQAHGRHTRH